MTFFGNDPHQDNLSTRFLETFETKRQCRQQHLKQPPDQAHTPLHLYALIDGAFDNEWGKFLWRRQTKTANADVLRSLYAGTRLEGMQECSPFLVRIDSETQLVQCQEMLHNSASKPMLTFIQTPLELAALQNHLGRFCQIQTPDSLVFPLRLADSIGLPDILDAFDEQQRGALLSGFTAWHTINRQGGVFTIDGACHDADSYTLPAVGEDDCIPFTDAQFVQLVDSAEGDEMLVMLFEERRALFSTAQPSVVFERVKSILKALDTRGINDMQTRRNAVKRYIALSDDQIAGMYYAHIDTICAP